MKITKSQLKRIIKEELKEVERHGQDAPTEFELYGQLSDVVGQLRQVVDNLEYAQGLSGREIGGSVDMSEVPDKVSGMITKAYRVLESARVALAKEIGQDPQPLTSPISKMFDQ